MELIGLRYFNVFGPRQHPEGPYAAVIPRFVRARLTGAAPVVNGDGLQSRDFTYVSDAVAANLLAAVAPKEACGRAYNVAAGRSVTLLDLVRATGALAGGGLEPVHEREREGDIRHSLADLTLAVRELGYAPGTPFEAGLERAFRAYQEEALREAEPDREGEGSAAEAPVVPFPEMAANASR
jgi:nucleoside-diphosphate-sugar epimerase